MLRAWRLPPPCALWTVGWGLPAWGRGVILVISWSQPLGALRNSLVKCLLAGLLPGFLANYTGYALLNEELL